MRSKIKLSFRELDVMNVLWDSKKSLTAKDIVKINPSLSINTVQVNLRSLLKENYIKVGDIVYSGTVLTRSYLPVLTADEYWTSQINLGTNKKGTVEGLVTAFLAQEKNEEEVIEILENLLEEYKRSK